MVERSYSNIELVEIIRSALARRLAHRRGGGMEEPGRAADRMLADGFDLATAFYALCNLLSHSRAEASPVDERVGSNAWWAVVFRQQQRRAEVFAAVNADALAILRAALAPTGPFVTIPKLGNAFHIRYRSDTDFSGIEIVTDDNGILRGSNMVMLLRRASASQELIDELDREACAALAAKGKPLMKKTRAGLIQPRLAAKGYNLAVGTIKNRLKPKRS
jgi:hypothetical protein